MRNAHMRTPITTGPPSSRGAHTASSVRPLSKRFPWHRTRYKTRELATRVERLEEDAAPVVDAMKGEMTERLTHDEVRSIIAAFTASVASEPGPLTGFRLYELLGAAMEQDYSGVSMFRRTNVVWSPGICGHSVRSCAWSHLHGTR